MLNYIYKLIDKNNGSILISDFMNAALYHKEYGYYMSKLPLGKDGDFITAPEISQLFGEVIAVWIICEWEKLGRPLKFSLVELGPGKGTLIHDIIRVTKRYSDFFHSMSINLVEISPSLRKVQMAKLQDLDINWHEYIDTLPKLTTIFLANEFFDALPIDQYVYYRGKLYENRVTKQVDAMLSTADTTNISIDKKKGFYRNSLLSRCHHLFITQVPASIDMMEMGLCFLPELGIQITNKELFDGAVVELCLTGIQIIQIIEEMIYNYKGAALIIDYGYIYPQYKSTLQAVMQNNYVNFLENIGNSDITSLVNFQALKNSLKYLNCEILTQREFLYLFGIKERAKILIKNITNEEQKSRIFYEYLRLTENMGTLFKVMLIEHL